jgi:hypothetical protein
MGLAEPAGRADVEAWPHASVAAAPQREFAAWRQGPPRPIDQTPAYRACPPSHETGGPAGAERGGGGLTTRDPRGGGRDVDVVAFYYPGADAPCDRLCRAPFLGNFWPVGPGGISLTATGVMRGTRTHQFENAEAAFQALKFWDAASRFESADGARAWRLRRELAGQEDFSYGGYGNRWCGMLAVLRQKFSPGSRLSLALCETGDAFLLQHNDEIGRDAYWSDN